MKKLNRAELEVLAKRIQKELAIAADEAQKRLNEIQDKQNLKLAGQILRQLKAMKPETRKYLGCRDTYEDLTVEQILPTLRKQQTEVKIKRHYHYSDEIMDALIIGQIDSPDVDSLASAVAAQFIKAPTA